MDEPSLFVTQAAPSDGRRLWHKGFSKAMFMCTFLRHYGREILAHA
jgi:hypothetical protein